tara:strand:+ start:272 stop:1285 length:1014 start_codon:yes stop_codon:yes gene_type:complete
MQPPADDDDSRTTEERIAYLRSHGVEVDLAEERGAKKPAVPAPGAPSFTFVHIPADVHSPITSHEGIRAGNADLLPSLLAPCFASDEAMDPAVVMRETHARIKSMMLGGGTGADALRAPSAQEIQKQATGGACEAYPLAPASEENGWRAVRLYLDEVGALRSRPRNRRAEDLAAAAGLSDLSFHGDVYVGRCERGDTGEHNVSFSVDELAPSSEWAMQARKAHDRMAHEMGHGDKEHLAKGSGDKYSWTQTDEDLEVRVQGAPTVKGAAKRVSVSYGRGESLTVTIDSVVVVGIVRLFDRVTPDECSWSLDNGEVVVTLEKADPRAWTDLALPGLGL